MSLTTYHKLIRRRKGPQFCEFNPNVQRQTKMGSEVWSDCAVTQLFIT